MVWLAAPEDSGIEFLDKDHPERPRRHIMIKFEPSPASRLLTAVVAYHVNKHISAGRYQSWMEIYGHLASGEGTGFQDMGAIRLPVQIDTHISTKLLMLAVIGFAVLLFIVDGEKGLLDAYPMIRGPFEISVPDDYEAGSLPQTVTGIHRHFMVKIVAALKSAGAFEVAPLPEHSIRR